MILDTVFALTHTGHHGNIPFGEDFSHAIRYHSVELVDFCRCSWLCWVVVVSCIVAGPLESESFMRESYVVRATTYISQSQLRRPTPSLASP